MTNSECHMPSRLEEEEYCKRQRRVETWVRGRERSLSHTVTRDLDLALSENREIFWTQPSHLSGALSYRAEDEP